MAARTTRGARLQIIGNSNDWIREFQVDDYVGNPPLIEQLHQDKQLALVTINEYEARLERARVEIESLKLDRNSLKHALAESTSRSSVSFALALLAALLIAVGANLATTSPRSWIGWFVISAGCFSEILAFASKPRNRHG